MDISEKGFEASIEEALLERGYRKREPSDYDRALCLDPRAVIGFVQATQPEEWEKLREQHGEDARARFLRRLSDQVKKRGTLDVLRNGIRETGCRFDLAYFRPATTLNPDLQTLYQANSFTVIRQFAYSEGTELRLDICLFLNGLPIFTAELKNPLTGQDYGDAIHQYRTARDQREPLFAFGRCLAHWAVDPNRVAVTTHLQGQATRFLPFDRGNNGGAGNPPDMLSFPTAYLWEETWAPDSVLNLVERFVHVIDVENDRGRPTGEKRVVFPRYHQLDCVRRLVDDAREHGPGRKYLIQHSAGSGKTYSISWLAHQLSTLHDERDERVFDSVIAITDRRVLDRQLQRHIRAFEQTRGVVENIDKTSRQLKAALEAGRHIIVTTLQKFPMIADEMGELPGKRFAVIIDEAHSSQTGESTTSLKKTLAVRDLETAASEEAGEPETYEDRIAAQMEARGPQPNVSTFAFTATPKAKTLELFGTQREDGRFAPFSLYSMRQAIEERFILDVLRNYTTYETYWRLLKTIEEDPEYDERQASGVLQSYVSLHEHAIEQKVAIMLDHFANTVGRRIGGRAKAMIVTRSRLHAVRYKLAVDRRIREQGHRFRALVAFSGTVRDPDTGIDYTEPGMNGFPETQTAEQFKRNENRIMVVAEKFQTGFDQPLLHTMYVDKRLSGVHAVQTLSRLNRIHPPDKAETMVLDFANDAENIREAFQPYYEATLLSEETDANLLHDLEQRLESAGFYGQEDLDRYAEVYFGGKATQVQLLGALRPAVDRFNDAHEDEQKAFRDSVNDFVRLYSFLSQIITFTDAELEKLCVFGRRLWPMLVISDGTQIHPEAFVDMETYQVGEDWSGDIGLDRGNGSVDPQTGDEPLGAAEEELLPLSEIIRHLNERFGADLGEDVAELIEGIEQRLAANESVAASVTVNTPENARLTFNTVADDMLQDTVGSHFSFYKQFAEDPAFRDGLLDIMFQRYLQAQGGPAAAGML